MSSLLARSVVYPVTGRIAYQTTGHPHVSGGFDFFLDVTNGNDSNDGTTVETAWKTLGQLDTYIVNTLTDGATIKVRVVAGTYDGGLLTSKTFSNPTTIEIYCDSGCTFQKGAAGYESCINPSGNNVRVILYGNGLTITDFTTTTGNGLGTAGTSYLEAYDCTITNCIDGMSCHNSGEMHVYNCAVSNCSKSAFNHINSGVFTATNTTFTSAVNPSQGIGQNNADQTHYFTGCTFIPQNNTNATSYSLDIRDCVLTQCVCGTTALRVNFGFDNTTLTDCYINATADLGRSGGGGIATTMTRCYGKANFRVRGTAGNAGLTASHCNFIGPASNASLNHFIYANFEADSTWYGSTNTITDCIIQGYTSGAGIGNGFTANQVSTWNANSSANYCCYYNNVVTSENVTAPSNTVTSDPLDGAANTTTQSDYAIGSESPCLNAASDGAGNNIGFSLADI